MYSRVKIRNGVDDMIFIERPLGMEDAESVCCGFEKAGRVPDFGYVYAMTQVAVWRIGGRNAVAVACDHGDRYYGFVGGVKFPVREAEALTIRDYLVDGPVEVGVTL